MTRAARVQVRILRPGDEDLLIDAAKFSGAPTLSHHQAANHLANMRSVYLVALDHNTPVGFSYGYVLPRFHTNAFFIYSVEVDESFRKNGVGRAMLSRLVEEGRNGAWSEMFVITNANNEAAMALYHGAGGVRPNGDDVLFDFK